MGVILPPPYQIDDTWNISYTLITHLDPPPSATCSKVTPVSMATYKRLVGSPTSGGSQMLVTKPPKPPCWLDLKSQNEPTFLSDEGSKSSPVNSQGQTLAQTLRTCSTKQGKRVRKRPVHRTRSQYRIDPDDLPECELTTLADTDPKDIGIGKQVANDQMHMQETTRKCQNWLESIEGCGPPEGIVISKIDSLDSDSVDVEVPDQTLCYEDGELWHHRLESANSSDDEKSSNRNRKQTAHRSQTNKKPSFIKGSGKKYQYDILSRDISIVQ